MENKILFIGLVLLIFLFGCTPGSNKQNIDNSIDSTMQGKPAIIAGKILNLEKYPNFKEIELTIPGFMGDEMGITSNINEIGEFKIEFYPRTKREVKLYPIEDVLIIQPGDSLYVIKDFNNIGESAFTGDMAILNKEISKFRGVYLGRYQTDYKLPYIEFKKYCEEERVKHYERLIEFQQKNFVSDSFNNWATKQIELDFCNALFNYPHTYYRRSGQKMTDSIQYYSFIGKLEENVDNSIILSDYFKVTEQFVNYQLGILQKKYQKEIVSNDTIVDLLIEDVFSAPKNNYLAQFSLITFLNSSLKANKTEWIDNNREHIEGKIVDLFLKNSLKVHYDRVNNFNSNPKPFSDAILGVNSNSELQKGITINSDNNENIVREVIAANPGKVIYVDFWATWCPPCIYYMDFSKKLLTNFEGKDVVFVFICINSEKNSWEEKVNELQLGGSHIYCNEEETRAIRKRFKFSGVPYYLLINKKGVIIDFGLHLNPHNESVKSQIAKLINE